MNWSFVSCVYFSIPVYRENKKVAMIQVRIGI